MKIKKFIDIVQYTLLHRAGLDLITLKYFLTEFQKCLTKTEYNRVKSQLQVLSLTTSQQLTLNQSLNNAIAKNLDEKLTKLKNGCE